MMLVNMVTRRLFAKNVGIQGLFFLGDELTIMPGEMHNNARSFLMSSYQLLRAGMLDVPIREIDAIVRR